MVTIAGHNIYTGLGFGSQAVYSKLRANEHSLTLRENVFDLPDPFVASLFDRNEIDSRFGNRNGAQCMTNLEKAMILSAEDAIAMSGIDAASPETIFIISSTKGNVELLENSPMGDDPRLALWHSARIVSEFFGNKNEPICVTNACTSGICAQIVAKRAIEISGYVNAVVIGADMLSKFIVSGFQSLKALSQERCKPFDLNRKGLNLSEGVSTIILTSSGNGIGIEVENGCIRNDANHISAPSRTAAGQTAAIEAVLNEEISRDLAFINLHGTATLYNDSMESVALYNCRLDSIPAVSYKSMIGHTLGASGVIETVVSCMALLEGVVFPTIGYEECGVQYPLNLSDHIRSSNGNRFLKIMSGFGGINAAVLYRRFGNE